MDMIAWISIGVAFACALWIAADEVRHPQSMAVMNAVWPITALYFNVFAVWGYYRYGRKKTKAAMSHNPMKPMDNKDHGGSKKSPTVEQVGVGASHCGAGCMAADVFCEFGIAAAGITLLGSVLWLSMRSTSRRRGS